MGGKCSKGEDEGDGTASLTSSRHHQVKQKSPSELEEGPMQQPSVVEEEEEEEEVKYNRTAGSLCNSTTMMSLNLPQLTLTLYTHW